MNLLPRGANSFLFEWTPFQKGSGAGKHKGSHTSCLPYIKWRKSYQVYPGLSNPAPVDLLLTITRASTCVVYLGPVVQKLTMSLVNVSLKTLLIKYGIYTYIFAAKMLVAFAFKSYSHFLSKIPVN